MSLIGKMFGKKQPEVVDPKVLTMAAELANATAPLLAGPKPEKRRLLSSKPKFTPRTEAGRKRKRLRQAAKKARRMNRLRAS